MKPADSSRPDLLTAIVAATKTAVQDRTVAVPFRELEKSWGKRVPGGRRFVEGLRRLDRYNVIAECKRRSPSRGVLSDVYDPSDIASGYAHAGAAAVSVLTEPAFFDGRLEHLEAVREAVELPLLRKDFIVTDYQLLEACLAGADAVLLIAAILDTSELRRLLRQAKDYGLAVLTEVHNAEELSRSLEAGAEVIGVNNRDLRSFDVDLEASEVLMEQIPADVTAVAESGLTSAGELIGLRRAGYHAFLIGGAFMCQPVPGEALSDLLRDVHLKMKVPDDGGG